MTSLSSLGAIAQSAVGHQAVITPRLTSRFESVEPAHLGEDEASGASSWSQLYVPPRDADEFTGVARLLRSFGLDTRSVGPIGEGESAGDAGDFSVPATTRKTQPSVTVDERAPRAVVASSQASQLSNEIAPIPRQHDEASESDVSGDSGIPFAERAIDRAEPVDTRDAGNLSATGPDAETTGDRSGAVSTPPIQRRAYENSGQPLAAADGSEATNARTVADRADDPRQQKVQANHEITPMPRQRYETPGTDASRDTGQPFVERAVDVEPADAQAAGDRSGVVSTSLIQRRAYENSGQRAVGADGSEATDARAIAGGALARTPSSQDVNAADPSPQRAQANHEIAPMPRQRYETPGTATSRDAGQPFVKRAVDVELADAQAAGDRSDVVSAPLIQQRAYENSGPRVVAADGSEATDARTVASRADDPSPQKVQASHEITPMPGQRYETPGADASRDTGHPLAARTIDHEHPDAVGTTRDRYGVVSTPPNQQRAYENSGQRAVAANGSEATDARAMAGGVLPRTPSSQDVSAADPSPQKVRASHEIAPMPRQRYETPGTDVSRDTGQPRQRYETPGTGASRDTGQPFAEPVNARAAADRFSVVSTPPIQRYAYENSEQRVVAANGSEVTDARTITGGALLRTPTAAGPLDTEATLARSGAVSTPPINRTDSILQKTQTNYEITPRSRQRYETPTPNVSGDADQPFVERAVDRAEPADARASGERFGGTLPINGALPTVRLSAANGSDAIDREGAASLAISHVATNSSGANDNFVAPMQRRRFETSASDASRDGDPAYAKRAGDREDVAATWAATDHPGVVLTPPIQRRVDESGAQPGGAIGSVPDFGDAQAAHDRSGVPSTTSIQQRVSEKGASPSARLATVARTLVGRTDPSLQKTQAGPEITLQRQRYEATTSDVPRDSESLFTHREAIARDGALSPIPRFGADGPGASADFVASDQRPQDTQASHEMAPMQGRRYETAASDAIDREDSVETQATHDRSRVPSTPLIQRLAFENGAEPDGPINGALLERDISPTSPQNRDGLRTAHIIAANGLDAMKTRTLADGTDPGLQKAQASHESAPMQRRYETPASDASRDRGLAFTQRAIDLQDSVDAPGTRDRLRAPAPPPIQRRASENGAQPDGPINGVSLERDVSPTSPQNLDSLRTARIIAANGSDATEARTLAGRTDPSLQKAQASREIAPLQPQLPHYETPVADASRVRDPAFAKRAIDREDSIDAQATRDRSGTPSMPIQRRAFKDSARSDRPIDGISSESHDGALLPTRRIVASGLQANHEITPAPREHYETPTSNVSRDLGLLLAQREVTGRNEESTPPIQRRASENGGLRADPINSASSAARVVAANGSDAMETRTRTDRGAALDTVGDQDRSDPVSTSPSQRRLRESGSPPGERARVSPAVPMNETLPLQRPAASFMERAADEKHARPDEPINSAPPPGAGVIQRRAVMTSRTADGLQQAFNRNARTDEPIRPSDSPLNRSFLRDAEIGDRDEIAPAQRASSRRTIDAMSASFDDAPITPVSRSRPVAQSGSPVASESEGERKIHVVIDRIEIAPPPATTARKSVRRPKAGVTLDSYADRRR